MRVNAHIAEGEVRDGLGPMQRWERDGGAVAVSVIVQRVADGETLKEICRSRGWPYSVVAKWIAMDEVVKGAYEGALAIWGDALAQEAVAIADGADPEFVPAAKLKVDTRLKLAGKWDRARYGEKTEVKHSGLVPTLVIEIGGVPAAPREIDVTPLPAAAAVAHELI
jgi:hypothetical protein